MVRFLPSTAARVLALSFLGAAPVLAAPCGPPTLARDLTTGLDGLRAQDFLALGSSTLFLGWRSSEGYEPWITDGTAAGTRLLVDLVPGQGSSNPVFVGRVGSVALFSAGATSMRSLWMTDGTGAGTVLVAAGVDAHAATLLGARLYFGAATVATGNEPWTSDGTPTGTGLLQDLVSGPSASDPTGFVEAAGRVYFVAYTNGYQIWSTDGSPGGTVPVTTALGLPLSADDARPLAVLGSDLLYPCGQTQLCKYETATGVESVICDVNRMNATEGVKYLRTFQGAVYFAGFDGVRHGLWRSDGTAAGCGELTPVEVTRSLEVAGGKLFFASGEGLAPGCARLWASDGTASGTLSLRVPVGDWRWFEPDLARVTGPAQGRSMSERGPDGGPATDFVDTGSGLLFTSYGECDASTAPQGSEPWTSDGTLSGTRLLADIVPGIESSMAGALPPARPPQFARGGDGSWYFNATTPALGSQAWHTDLTTAGTTLLASIGGTRGSAFGVLAAVNDRVVFNCHGAQGTVELWSSDGTDPGTERLASWDRGVTAFGLDSARGYAWYAAPLTLTTPPGGDRDLWRTDGTVAGTAPFLDIAGGDASSDPEGFLDTSFGLFFEATDPLTGRHVYATDGTAARTRQIASMPTDPCCGIPSLKAATGSGLLFNAGNDAWWSDGLTAWPLGLPAGGVDGRAAVVGSQVYFMRSGRLWHTDGTQAGTAPSWDASTWLDLMGSANGIVYATSTVLPSSGEILWAWDVVRRTPQVLGQFTAPSQPVAQIGTTFYFFNSQSGLWKTDGSASGTELVTSNASWPFFRSGAELYYPGSLAELWRTDGTQAGTFAVAPGLRVGSTGPRQLAATRDRLFFVADDGSTGYELWSLCLDPLRAALLRNTDVRPPGLPRASDLLPLRLARDRYLDAFLTGTEDPPPIVTDASRPLVLYALDDERAVIRLAKSPALGIRIAF